MRTLVNRILILGLAITVGQGSGIACFQPFSSVRLRTRVFSGIVTTDGKPIEGTLLRLFRIDNGPHEPVGNMETGGMRRSRWGDAITDNQGRFSFGEVPVGRYELVTTSGVTEVEVTGPDDGDSVLINSYGMGCLSARVFIGSRNSLREMGWSGWPFSPALVGLPR